VYDFVGDGAEIAVRRIDKAFPHARPTPKKNPFSRAATD
jgi:hypothetical protein